MKAFILTTLFGLLLLVSVSAGDKKPDDSAAPYELNSVLDQPTLWSLTKDNVANALKGGPFRWVSAEKTEIRGGDTPLIYQGIPVQEVIFRFAGDKLSQIYLSIYNRGDGGAMSTKDFAALIDHAEQILQSQSGVDGADVDSEGSSSKYENKVKIWLSPSVSYRLETASSKSSFDGVVEKRAEYVNLTIMPGGLTADDVNVQRKVDLDFVDFDTRLQHDPNGDVWIPSVPMVDQGHKGYCVVATMERILRYYGSQVSEHEVAQHADSSASQGTTLRGLSEAMHSITSSLGLSFTEFRKFDAAEFGTFVDDYNAAAKREGRVEVSLSTRSVEDVYHQMDAEIVRDLRLKNPQHVESFFNYISSTIDKGWPIAWTVYLGWIEENPPLGKGAHGSHMRLIIGYNPDTQEIIYSDSWGLGHEFKRMAANDAYIMTADMFIVEPKQ